MKNLAFGSWSVGVVVALAACGGGGGTRLVDGGADAPTACNPVAQTGCQAGEKCTWIIDIDGTATTPDVGHIGCAVAGTTPDAATCTDATAASGGFDTCVAGDLCIGGKCKPICDPQVIEGSAAPGACANNFACSRYAAVFETGGQAVAGVCEPTCDPLSQRLNTTQAEACGSLDATKPRGTCVVGAGFRTFHCAPTGSMLYGLTDRMTPLTDSTGNPYGNGCAPGFMPFFYEMSGSTKVLCTGLCAPVKMDSAIFGSNATPANIKPWGNLTTPGKLVADAMPVAGHSVCTVEGGKGSIPPDNMGKGIEDCRFAWAFLVDDTGHLANTQYNDTLGFCYPYTKFQFTPTGSTTKLTEKSCAELPPTAPVGDPYGTAKDWGCYSSTESTQRQSLRRKTTIRLGYGSGPITRHVFD